MYYIGCRAHTRVYIHIHRFGELLYVLIGESMCKA